MSDAPLWTLSEVVRATGGTLCGPDTDPGYALEGVSIDSRTLGPRDLFVAIKGDRLDGHDYVEAAARAGAKAAIVGRGFLYGEQTEHASVSCPLIRVGDTLEALGAMARSARARFGGKVVAVTGSVGKTGTKEMLRRCLSTSGATHAAERSFNNHWGVPLTLSRLPRTADHAVIEIGMNHPGEIRPLVHMARPHVAIVTTVEAVHLEFFDSVEQIADAKAEIFEGLVPGGTAVINRDNPHFARLLDAASSHGARVVSFGQHSAANVRLLDLHEDAGASTFRVALNGRTLDVRIGVPGRHLVQNALAVLGACDALGVDAHHAGAALTTVTAPKGRGARSLHRAPGGQILVVDESYNANPASIRAALETLSTVPRHDFGRRVVVLGDMLELGATSHALHRGLAAPIEDAGVDLVFTAGPMMEALQEALPAPLRGHHAASSAELQNLLLDNLRAGDVVMLKGSLASRIGPLVDAIREKFPEQLEAFGAGRSAAMEDSHLRS